MSTNDPVQVQVRDLSYRYENKNRKLIFKKIQPFMDAYNLQPEHFTLQGQSVTLKNTAQVTISQNLKHSLVIKSTPKQKRVQSAKVYTKGKEVKIKSTIFKKNMNHLFQDFDQYIHKDKDQQDLSLRMMLKRPQSVIPEEQSSSSQSLVVMHKKEEQKRLDEELILKIKQEIEEIQSLKHLKLQELDEIEYKIAELRQEDERLMQSTSKYRQLLYDQANRPFQKRFLKDQAVTKISSYWKMKSQRLKFKNHQNKQQITLQKCLLIQRWTRDILQFLATQSKVLMISHKRYQRVQLKKQTVLIQSYYSFNLRKIRLVILLCGLHISKIEYDIYLNQLELSEILEEQIDENSFEFGRVIDLIISQLIKNLQFTDRCLYLNEWQDEFIIDVPRLQQSIGMTIKQTSINRYYLAAFIIYKKQAKIEQEQQQQQQQQQQQYYSVKKEQEVQTVGFEENILNSKNVSQQDQFVQTEQLEEIIIKFEKEIQTLDSKLINEESQTVYFLLDNYTQTDVKLLMQTQNDPINIFSPKQQSASIQKDSYFINQNPPANQDFSEWDSQQNLVQELSLQDRNRANSSNFQVIEQSNQVIQEDHDEDLHTSENKNHDIGDVDEIVESEIQIKQTETQRGNEILNGELDPPEFDEIEVPPKLKFPSEQSQTFQQGDNSHTNKGSEEKRDSIFSQIDRNEYIEQGKYDYQKNASSLDDDLTYSRGLTSMQFTDSDFRKSGSQFLFQNELRQKSTMHLSLDSVETPTKYIMSTIVEGSNVNVYQSGDYLIFKDQETQPIQMRIGEQGNYQDYVLNKLYMYYMYRQLRCIEKSKISKIQHFIRKQHYLNSQILFYEEIYFKAKLVETFCYLKIFINKAGSDKIEIELSDQKCKYSKIKQQILIKYFIKMSPLILTAQTLSMEELIRVFYQE